MLAKVFTVTKDEYDIIEDFILYYGYIFGFNNVVIIDNGSEDQRVLDVYEKYKNYGVEVYVELGYTRGSQGVHFTKHMFRCKSEVQYLIGLDTDEFLVILDEDKNIIVSPFELREYLKRLPEDYDIFTIRDWYNSVPDVTSEDYVNYSHQNPIVGIQTFGLTTETNYSKKFYRASNFIMTNNGNHSGRTTTQKVYDTSVGILHFHSTGIRRKVEKCRKICEGYNYIKEEDGLLDIIPKISNLGSCDGNHRVNQYLAFCRKRVCLEKYVRVNKSLPKKGENINSYYEQDVDITIPTDIDIEPTLYSEDYSGHLLEDGKMAALPNTHNRIIGQLVRKTRGLIDIVTSLRLPDALIGHTGFVGNSIKDKFKFEKLYNSSNCELIGETEYGLVVFSGAYAVKWYANTHEEEDMEHINKLIELASRIKCRDFILISTIDTESKDSNTPYGKHRGILEEKILELFQERAKVIRLPGLYGFGLKKNAIYDLIHKGIATASHDSEFQWYHINRLYKDIIDIIHSKESLVRLYSEPIKMSELYQDIPRSDLPVVKYQVKPYSFKADVSSYISHMRTNRLGISTLCLRDSKTQIDRLREICRNYGMDNNLEIAPYSYLGNDEDYYQHLTGKEEEMRGVYSMQAVLYPSKYNIFIDTTQILDRMKRIINFASSYGVKIIVFGSPKNRYLPEGGDRSIAVHFFRELGEYASVRNVIICIEPNAKEYGCNFITNSVEGRNFIIEVNHPNIRLHLDIGCMLLEKENCLQALRRNVDILSHVHLSSPGLKKLEPYEIKECLRWLSSDEYKGRYTIEMLPVEIDKVERIISSVNEFTS